jgi:eukaryotic-like serine/threonine-protein kinase
VGRYTLYEMIGAGGMAAVYLGRLRAGNGFSRTVAVKRLHPQLALDADFVDMFITEAKLAARIRHPNVVATIDVVHDGPDVLLVMDYVQGESLSALLRRVRQQDQWLPFDIVSGIFCGVLAGLQAAHTATQDDGSPLALVHRDVSPENVLVGADGVARVLDFGVAKAAGMSSITKEGTVKGKLAYMAPEQLLGLPVTPCTDLFALSAVLWETLTGRRAFKGDNDGETVNRILHEPIVPPSEYRPEIPAALEAVILKGLQRDIGERFQSAEEMQRALEEAAPPATSRKIAEWLKEVARESLAEKALKVATMESSAPALVDAIIPVEQDRTELDLASSSSLRRTSPRWHYLVPLAVLLVAAVALGAWALGRTREPPIAPVAGGTGTPTVVATVSQPTSTRAAPLPSAVASLGDPTGNHALPRPTATPTKRVVPKPTSTSLYSRD